MILELDYNYWGSNGREYQNGLYEYETVEEAIEAIGRIAYNDANNECVTIERVIGAPESVIADILNGVTQYVKQEKLKEKIRKTKEAIKEHQEWLDNVPSEIIRRTGRLATLHQELTQLEKTQ